MWRAYLAGSPRVLGCVLVGIVGVVRELVSVVLEALPRMADFAEWGEATGRGLGWGAGVYPAGEGQVRGVNGQMIVE